jgi:lysophospholipase L1-like esterase
VSNDNQRWSTIVAREAGWVEQNVALGGTGYVTTGPSGKCGQAYCSPYGKAAAVARSQYRPTLIIVSGGRNDVATSGRVAKPGVQNRAKALFEQLRRDFPNTPIYVTSPIWDNRTPPPGLREVRREVQTAAASVGVKYLDIGDPLRGHSDRISADGIHPNVAGHDAIARRTQAALAEIGA